MPPTTRTPTRTTTRQPRTTLLPIKTCLSSGGGEGYQDGVKKRLGESFQQLGREVVLQLGARERGILRRREDREGGLFHRDLDIGATREEPSEQAAEVRLVPDEK